VQYRDDDDEPEAEIEDDESEDDDLEFADMASVAWPAENWDDDRLAALKECIRICAEQDRAGKYGAGKRKALVLEFGERD